MRLTFPFRNNKPLPEENVRIFSQVFAVDGFKEMLLDDVFHYKKLFVESKGAETKYLYMAEAYQRLIEKMLQSHKMVSRDNNKP